MLRCPQVSSGRQQTKSLWIWTTTSRIQFPPKKIFAFILGYSKPLPRETTTERVWFVPVWSTRSMSGRYVLPVWSDTKSEIRDFYEGFLSIFTLFYPSSSSGSMLIASRRNFGWQDKRFVIVVKISVFSSSISVGQLFCPGFVLLLYTITRGFFFVVVPCSFWLILCYYILLRKPATRCTYKESSYVCKSLRVEKENFNSSSLSPSDSDYLVFVTLWTLTACEHARTVYIVIRFVIIKSSLKGDPEQGKELILYMKKRPKTLGL